MNPSIFHKKWIVVTTISAPTDDIKSLARIPGWNVLVIGDSKTPANWKSVNCTFLSLVDQRKLPLKSVQHIPTGSYARKAIGYLYAIAQGADFIYETDDDNITTDGLATFNLQQQVYGLLFAGTKLFNPYNHFGQPSMWPRGYPIDKIGHLSESDYLVDSVQTPYIQHGLVNGDPDMDAIFRLTRKLTKSRMNVRFDSVAPPVVLPQGVLSPFNSQNTLFLYDAFWAMVIPVTIKFHACDIWRGYWAQRLLWEIGGSLGFNPPNAHQIRNSHSYFNDAKEERALYFQISSLIDFLYSWTCPATSNFFQCVVTLSADMVDHGYWQVDDLNMIKAWLFDLQTIGYVEPKRQPFVRKPSNPKASPIPALFHASEQSYPPIHISMPPSVSRWRQVLGITSFCATTTYQISKTGLSTTRFPNILLIIVFNFPIYDNIPYLQLMYGVHFNHILYCGNDRNSFSKSSKAFRQPVSFIEVDVFRGYYAYRCLTTAMKMNYGVDGYMMIGDDTLLNTWHLPSFPVNKIWYTERSKLYRNKADGWHWWQTQFGSVVFNKAWQELQNMTHHEHRVKSTVENFMNIVKYNTGSHLGLFHAPSDILYIPCSYANNTIFFMDVFSKHNVFLELVIPTVIAGLEHQENIFTLKGQYLWYDGKRNQIPQLFKADDVYLHPVKLSIIKTTLKNFFCETFFPLALFGEKKNALNK
ncbi:hypothetical protein SNE40_013242 [Patella caerulea]|uniref:Uncharacterized protein n=1 Tax=Patella caerulea TaxID=87958 RepID=A0AAN8PNP3_PATCE